MLKFSLLILLIVCNFNVKAQWFDAKGRAPIVNGDYDIARNMAVQDALKHALIFTDAQVSSVSQVSNGLLSNDRFEVKSNGSVRDLQLISENRIDNTMVVHIRVDIVANEETTCPNLNSVKLVAMTKFPLIHRRQAVNGAIFNIGSHAAQKFFYMSSAHKGSFKTTQLLPLNQPLEQSYSTNNNQQNAQQFLAQQADSQYLLTAVIEDISVNPARGWLSIAAENAREFNISFSLFDGLNGQQVWSKRYSTTAVWSFERTEKVDSSSQHFWQSFYGSSIEDQFEDVISDIDKELQCLELKGSVVRVDDDFLTVNLGRRNGLKKGDKLTVYHLNTFTDNRGITRQSTIINPTKFIVKTIYSNHLEAAPEDGVLYGDVQNDSLVVLSH